jgi:A/G-specific adenine glycosylase
VNHRETLDPSSGRRFSAALIAWQRTAGRHDLPWQASRDPYRVWLSEIMLQQTQVATVIGYYERFLARFPDVATLAGAPLDEVMRLWSGLGYYSRARNLHRAAVEIMQRRAGCFPADRAELMRLPGIGRSTAAAIAAFAYGRREAILDGNVRRVLARQFEVRGDLRARAAELRLWAIAESMLPESDIESYTQALMDLGATVCVPRNPACAECPVAESCAALASGRVSEFPAPRPRRSVPLRRTRMLVLQWGGQVLLERRPPVGIWGGLWCLPELPEEAEIAPFALVRLGCSVGAWQALPGLRHSFTHFSLDIAPLHAIVEAPGRTAPDGLHAADGELAWHPLEAAARIGAPAPVKRILGALAAGSQLNSRSDRAAAEN